jgi:hypothetical protein
MKIKIFFTLFIGGILLSTASCKKSFFTDFNKNPNAPDSVPPNLLLSNVEASLAYTQGGDISRFTSLFTQQVYGANAQSQQYYNYILNPGTFDNLWPDYYTSVLNNNDTLMNLSDRKGYNIYSGMSRILMAYSLQMGVDLWGDLPYSQAMKGDGNLKPSYDKAQDLYDTVASLVNKGIAYLYNPDPGLVAPGADDHLYGGDTAAWAHFGHAILARLYIHQSKGNPAMANQALQEVAKSFGSQKEAAIYICSTSENGANPWYQFITQRPGDETFVDAPLSDSMQARNDPRFLIYIDPNPDDASLGPYYANPNSPVEFITFEELKFIAAEATLRSTGDFVTAAALLKDAVTENMTKLGVPQGDIDTYIAAHATLVTTSVDDAIAQVAREEYYALYLGPEVFTVWRRTGIPMLPSVIPGGNIPRRLLYPQTELSYNTANTPSVTLYSPRIFWDK